jgi:hypothetical protein
MKRLCMLATLAGVMAAPSLFASFTTDGTVKMDYGTYHSGSGGEFTAATTGLGTFLTFCIEESEYFAPGNTYSYKINTGAVAGGVAGAHSTDPNTGLSMDNISIGTAYLYSQFRNGGIVINSAQDAGNFQQALWYLEGEQTSLVNAGAGVDGTAYYNLAKLNAGNGHLSDAAVEADSGGAYGVVALNLFDGYPAEGDGYNNGFTAPDGKIHYLNQDMLGIVPEPTTVLAGMLLLLPFGASTLRILRKKIAA